MAKKIIRPLHSEADYDVALNEIERYFENEPKPGTPEADRFDLLALVIEDYERKRWPIEPPDTIDAICYRMDTGGYSQSDLGRLLGSRLAPTGVRYPDQKAAPYDENGLEAVPRMGHSSGSPDRAAANPQAQIRGVISLGGLYLPSRQS